MEWLHRRLELIFVPFVTSQWDAAIRRYKQFKAWTPGLSSGTSQCENTAKLNRAPLFLVLLEPRAQNSSSSRPTHRPAGTKFSGWRLFTFCPCWCVLAK